MRFGAFFHNDDFINAFNIPQSLLQQYGVAYGIMKKIFDQTLPHQRLDQEFLPNFNLATGKTKEEQILDLKLKTVSMFFNFTSSNYCYLVCFILLLYDI